MRLPQSLLDSQFFVFKSAKELVSAMGDHASPEEVVEINRLAELGLPPVSSLLALSTMLGINPGLVWSFINRPEKHYRNFVIPKGDGERNILAPKVALKIVQKWLSVHFQRYFTPPDHVFGFVPGRSHIDAAKVHVSADWVYSVDIADFFPSTPVEVIRAVLQSIGYREDSVAVLASLTCYCDRLVQGSPSSPVLSNMVLANIDRQLIEIAKLYSVRLSRYADDIVFSGKSEFPEGIREAVGEVFNESPWRLSANKEELCIRPRRLKVHGLLVHGNSVRLTKGYRNKLRAYRHLLGRNQISEEDIARVQGHIKYGDYVEVVSSN